MISWDRVRELRDEVGEDDFAEVVTLFLEEVDETLARMRTASTQASCAEDFHFLKGSALNLGFEALSTLCREKETAASAGEIEAGDIEEIVRVYETSKTAFLGTSAAPG